jgi:HSP20 family protein
MVMNRWNPWTELFSMRDQLLANDAFGRSVSERDIHTLPIDIRQSETSFEIEASVPGFKPEDIEITFDENVLTICGTHHEENVTRGAYVRRERRLHSVYRQVGLPAEVKANQIGATFENGILIVTVPRAQRAQPTRIAVTTSIEHPKLVKAHAAAA